MATKTSHLVRPLVALVALVAAMAALLIAYSASPVHAAGSCTTTAGTTTCTFAYTEAAQIWTVPDGVKQATFDVSGAQGGGTPNLVNETEILPGGKGGEATATITVTPGEMLQVNVGGKGGDGVEGISSGPGGAGGFNGGAAGGDGCCLGPGGGGGASDVRRDKDTSGGFALAERIIVAGGGGGKGGFEGGEGGVGGGLSGGPGGPGAQTCCGGPGLGGTQADGGDGGLGEVDGGTVWGDNGSKGDLGTGGAGGVGVGIFGDGGGGGGGGYYGGGGGGGGTRGGGGGGGSGFGPSGAVDFDSGVRSGNGLVMITYTTADTTPPTVTATALTATLPDGTPSKTTNVTATFSEKVQNVTTSTFILERNITVKKAPPKFERVAATVTPSPDGLTAELNPVQDLPKGDYRATITTDVTDVADNKLDQDQDPTNGNQPKVWTFTVKK